MIDEILNNPVIFDQNTGQVQGDFGELLTCFSLPVFFLLLFSDLKKSTGVCWNTSHPPGYENFIEYQFLPVIWRSYIAVN